MTGTVHILAWSAWSPGIQSQLDWTEWAEGKRTPEASSASPPLGHLEPLFKRRFSQLTRMTLHVGHEALAGRPPMKVGFASTWGEISQQYKITSKLIEEHEVSPANFSLSVFNTPVAALTIAEKNTEGYVACYPGKEAFALGFLESAAAILSGAERERLFIIADELLPADYVSLQNGPNQPYALALVLSWKPSERLDEKSTPVELDEVMNFRNASKDIPDALVFLRDKILSGKTSR